MPFSGSTAPATKSSWPTARNACISSRRPNGRSIKSSGATRAVNGRRSTSSKIAANVAAGTGLGAFAFVTGARKRASQVFQTLGVAADTPDLHSDLTTLIFHLEAHQRLRNDKRLVAAAGAFWAQTATPFAELETVTGVRTAFGALVADLGEIGTALKSHLFSSNAAIIAKLRTYQPWIAQFQSDLEAWPEPLDAVPLRAGGVAHRGTHREARPTRRRVRRSSGSTRPRCPSPCCARAPSGASISSTSRRRSRPTPCSRRSAKRRGARPRAARRCARPAASPRRSRMPIRRRDCARA